MLSRILPHSFKLRNSQILNVQRRLQQTKFKLTGSRDVVPIFGNAHLFPDKIALRDTAGTYTYANLFLNAKNLSGEITKRVDGKTGQRIMFLCPNDADYVTTLWAIWMSGQIAVPLSPQHPKSTLLYYANDTNASLLITTPKFAELMMKVSKNTNTKLHVLDDKQKTNSGLKNSNPEVVLKELDSPLATSFYNTSNALILYTSGTTGAPKGVVLSHKNLVFQVNALLNAWKWSQDDVILHTLPLHHVHGIVNALLCPLYIGAKTIMLPKFNVNSVWSHLLGANLPPDRRKITVYMAVPTIYSKLIDEYQRVFSGDQKMVEYIRTTLKNKIRLMVSGSAPLPVPIFEKWEKISGHKLLERYGMTEVGMALSNLYEGDREPGYVGVPLPGVSVKLNTEDGRTVLECTNEHDKLSFTKENQTEYTGDLLVKSDGVFSEYFNRPDATKNEFLDGWFKTGDICSYSIEKNKFKILGRKSMDIIKSGGYKISALEIETKLMANPNLKDCVVVGVDDEEWGQRVGAVIVPQDKGEEVTLDSLREWCSDKMPKYHIPTLLKIVKEIPKNAMGKVNKKELVNNIFNIDK